MNSVSNITNRIIADAQKQATEIHAQAEESAGQTLTQYMQQSEEATAEIMQEAEKTAQTVVNTAAAKIDMKKRLKKLESRRGIINQVFEKAFDRIKNLDDDGYLTFLKSLLADCVKNAETVEPMQLILNAEDKEKLGEALVKDLNGEDGSNIVVLAEKTGEQVGGFVLIDGEIEINCTFEVIFKSAKEQYQDDVVKKVFG